MGGRLYRSKAARVDELFLLADAAAAIPDNLAVPFSAGLPQFDSWLRAVNKELICRMRSNNLHLDDPTGPVGALTYSTADAIVTKVHPRALSFERRLNPFMPASYTVAHPGELLAFLFACRPEVKKTKVRQWLKHGSVQVNGRSITRTKHPLKKGDLVSIRAKDDVLAEALLPPGLKILFEDESLLVIDKPEHLLSMASATERDNTAYAFLTAYVRRRKPRSRQRVWIVHRLDREASGLMVFAKTEEVKRALQARWSKAEKRYLAVVEGHPPAEQGVMRSHLDESRTFKVKSTARGEGTRLAVTHYRLVKRSVTRALVELTLETGRRNQIRVHLADAKCPIVGDRKYGARTNPARRLGLHACAVELEHPVTGELVKFESPLPHALARLL